MTKASCPTTTNALRIPVQPWVREAVELNRVKIDNKQVIDVDGWCPFGRYQVHITDQGRSWLRISDREWELAFQNVTRFQSDGRRKNSRMMPTAWGRQQPRQLPGWRGFRAAGAVRDGRRRA